MIAENGDRQLADALGGVLTDDMRERLRAFEEIAIDAYAPATLDLVQRTASRFAAYLRGTNHGAFPEEPQAVVGFIEHLGADQKPASVRAAVAALSTLYRAASFEGDRNPTRSKLVALALRRLDRAKGTRQRQARPVYGTEMAQMLAACPADLAGLRDRALLTVMSACLLRRSEVVVLRVGDTSREPDGSSSVFIARSKTDQTGDGAFAPMRSEETETLTEYMSAAGLDPEKAEHADEPLFRRVSSSGRLLDKPLSKHSITYLLRRAATRAGLTEDVVTELTSHSLRRGTATEMLNAGVAPLVIQQAGRWKGSSDMVARYTNARTHRRDAAASRRALLDLRETTLSHLYRRQAEPA